MSYKAGVTTITLGLPQEQLDAVDKRAAKANCSRAEWMRRALAWALLQPMRESASREMT